MGCVQAKPSGGNSEAEGLERLKLENGYVANGDFIAHRRSMGLRYGEIRRHQLGSDNGNEEREASSNQWMKEGKKTNALLDGEKLPRKSFDDEMVDGWPRWLVDNVPREVLAGLVPRTADSYILIDKVGQGTYSNVYKARDRATGELVALKKVRFDKSQPESIKFMAREIMILQRLDHPNVMKLKGLATSRMQYSIYLVFDFMQSDMTRIISRPEERLTEPQVKCYMHQLLSGLQHCHDRGILHRDIKGSNLLVDKNGMLKIADFGLANFYNPNCSQYLTNRVVTLWYRAPELLLGATNYGVGIDLWSVGCLLAEMFRGIPIMPGRTEVEQLHIIFRLCGTPSEEYWKKLNLSTTFRPPKSYRPSLAESFKDLPPSSVGLLCTLLTLDPAYRGTASKALQNHFFFTSPPACDLSGLPVIYTEFDGQNLTNEQIKHANFKLRRSHIHHESERKNLASGWQTDHTASSEEELSKKVEAYVPDEEQGSIPRSSRTSSVSNTAELNVALDDQKLTHKIHGHVNFKNLPSLPKSKQHASFEEDNSYRPHQILRSASSREFRDPKQGVFEIHG